MRRTLCMIQVVDFEIKVEAEVEEIELRDMSHDGIIPVPTPPLQ